MNNKQTILLVDDEKSFVDVTKIRLEHSGYDVITAYDGQEALEKAKESSPDLILLDIMLPKLDGYKVCKILKFDEHYRHIPVVMLTALSQHQDKQTGYESGADKYLTKPFDPKELLHTIDSLLTTGTGPSAKDVLRIIDLFAPLSDDEIAVISSNCDIVQYPAGTVLIEEGKTDTDMFVVISGEVQVDQTNASGQWITLCTLGANTFFGESSLLLGEPRTATVTTLKPTTCVRISKELISTVLTTRPEIGYDMGRIIIERKTFVPSGQDIDSSQMESQLNNQFQL